MRWHHLWVLTASIQLSCAATSSCAVSISWHSRTRRFGSEMSVWRGRISLSPVQRWKLRLVKVVTTPCADMAAFWSDCYPVELFGLVTRYGTTEIRARLIKGRAPCSRSHVDSQHHKERVAAQIPTCDRDPAQVQVRSRSPDTFLHNQRSRRSRWRLNPLFHRCPAHAPEEILQSWGARTRFLNDEDRSGTEQLIGRINCNHDLTTFARI